MFQAVMKRGSVLVSMLLGIRRAALHIKSEGDNITVADNIGLAFKTE